MKFMPEFEKKVDCFKYNFVLILFHHAATNHKKDGNLKISANVIHFLSFAGMLPVILGIFSLSSHFCQARRSKTEVSRQNDGHDGS